MRARALALLAALVLTCPETLTGRAYAATETGEGPCLSCHEDTTPQITLAWQLSSHAGSNVLCSDCHGQVPEKAHSAPSVSRKLCGSCHQGAFMGQEKGRHRDAGVRCSSCHGSHSTDMDPARDPRRCSVCHGESCFESWASSPHGATAVLQPMSGSPVCATCHMPGGSHNVSTGIAFGRPADVHGRERPRMVDTCMNCHSPRLAEKTLKEAEAAAVRQRSLVAEAESIVRALYSEGIITDGPDEGPRASLRRLRAIAQKEAANPFHRFGQGDMDKAEGPIAAALEALKAEASLTKRLKTFEQRLENLASAARPAGSEPDRELLKKELRTLRDRFLSGEIPESKYEKEKKRLLDEAGL